MRKIIFKENKYYKLSNVGIGDVFIDDEDKTRFLFLILHLQSPIKINNSRWYTYSFGKNGYFKIDNKIVKHILDNRYVELFHFDIQNNKFDLLVKNLVSGCVSVYMHRILTAYSKYYNAKYNLRGKVFTANFEAVNIKNDNLSSAVSPKYNLPKKDIDNIFWSSAYDHKIENRCGDLLSTKI